MMKKLMILIVSGVGVISVGSVINGFVLVKLWSWFIVPTFGVQPLFLVPAIGFCMVVSFLTRQARPSKNDGDTVDAVSLIITEVVLVPAISLIFGWVVSWFM